MLSHFKQLIKYRTLIGALVVRHLSIRYRGSLLGFLWSLLNPLILMLVYTLVFSYYMRFDQKNYSVFLFTGLLPWLWLSSALSEGTTSIVSSGHLITKSMFPPNILPFVSVVTNMIHYLLALPLLLIFMLFSRMPFHWTLLLVPFVILIQFTLSYGIALVLSSLNVKFRDIQHLVGNALTFLFFLCPIL